MTECEEVAHSIFNSVSYEEQIIICKLPYNDLQIKCFELTKEKMQESSNLTHFVADELVLLFIHLGIQKQIKHSKQD